MRRSIQVLLPLILSLPSGLHAQDDKPSGPSSLFEPLRLSLLEILSVGAEDTEASPCQPYEDEYYDDETVYYYRRQSRFDFFVGGFAPLEDSEDAANENFDAGVILGFRFQREIVPDLFLGVQFDFATHEIDSGDVLFEGDLDRLFFMVPLTWSWPIDRGPVPIRLELTVAPGVQVALPDIDRDLEDDLAFLGRFVDQDDFAAFDLRFGLTLRIPIGPWSDFFVETCYDWAIGSTEVDVRNAIGQLIERRDDSIDLSAFSMGLGLSVVF